ncbi:MAG TPA: AraC family transcriptional regulator [Polyangiales bacterium]
MLSATRTESWNEAEPNNQHRLRGATGIVDDCRLLLRELRSRGLNVEPALAALGLSGLELGDPRSPVSLAQLEAFAEMAVTLSGDADIGLHAGQAAQLEDLGLMGLLLRASPDLRTALHYLQRYRDTVPQALEVDVTWNDRVVICRRGAPGVRAPRVLSEYGLARTLRLIQLLVGPTEALEVRSMHPAPAHSWEQRRVLGERVRFNQPEDALIFSASLLARPMLQPDPVIAAVLARHFDVSPGARSVNSSELIPRVRRAIRAELGHGRATMNDIAARLNTTERTLRRQLNDLGTSFQTLLDEVRFAETLQGLESGHLISAVSRRVGFGGRAAFYRAFRRWTGMSLAEYRQNTNANPEGWRS